MSHFRHTSAGPSLVIPAKAGIQQKKKLRVAGKTIVPLRGDYSINWIPACAGMTEEERA